MSYIDDVEKRVRDMLEETDMSDHLKDELVSYVTGPVLKSWKNGLEAGRNPRKRGKTRGVQETRRSRYSD